MDDRVIKAALDSFENDDFLHAKELIQGQIRQTKNDFLKGKLDLKNDIEKQFTELTSDNYETELEAEPKDKEDVEPEPDPVAEPTPKKRMFPKKKINK